MIVNKWFVALLALTSLVAQGDSPIAFAIHGGAGVAPKDLTPEQEAECRKVLAQAVQEGHATLKSGGSGLEAVQKAIIILEDSPLFNAGRGSVLTAAGTVEMDASIMDGRTLQAGAVAGITTVRNPILLANVVMTKTPHVLMIGAGAEALAREHALKTEAPEWFITPKQMEKLRRAQKKSAVTLSPEDIWMRVGTVGAVALDKEGHLAAGTSTGGLTNKKAGRVGDSPIIGAGTYAEDGVCAVSGTGHGEFFIRNVVGHDVAARMKYGKATLVEAADAVIARLSEQKGVGGIIAIDAQGRVHAPFNTPGMFRAWIGTDGQVEVKIFVE
ncbi:isoaspartyl peptidase/L-asparaginase family protein [Brevifollis gellanilyticus]|uniref:Isoaspartyl peptidase n=1 Tax=Brevifollis gellanilyticus TaxID=748831 RepID=A0A512MDL9_9BACT|nr:isoaspartyl peptidase/L-asparaginase [Brevifollis gellanilyticus]GEP44836.1 isoaspartyl peptidase/L-asparaginase [Brevifollis gellanilyticus]